MIKMRNEYILIHDDKFVISRFHKDREIDFQTTPKWHRLRIVLGAIILLLVFVFILLPLPNMSSASQALIKALSCSLLGAFGVYYFHECFYFSDVSEIQKEKITEIRLTKTRSIVIEFRNGKRKRGRMILLPAEKQERELALQLLRDNKVLAAK
jgi:hypothetical protein